jgi:hypothetical protein
MSSQVPGLPSVAKRQLCTVCARALTNDRRPAVPDGYADAHAHSHAQRTVDPRAGNVVVAQVRSIATDLLRATGPDDSMSIRAVRRAVGRLAA